MTSPTTDQPLLVRVAAGDPTAVQRLIDRYGALVWSIARKQLGASGSEDIVQEIFIEIWRSAERYDPTRASEATFITTIARRRLIDRRRQISKRPESVALHDEIPNEVESDLAAVELSDEARVAEEAMQKLRPEQERVLRLSLINGMSYPEIAKQTELPLGTVKSHARRGLMRVRALLGTNDDEDEAAS